MAEKALGRSCWHIFPGGIEPVSSCKSTVNGCGDIEINEEFSVGNKVFLSQGYEIIDESTKYPLYFYLITDITGSKISHS